MGAENRDNRVNENDKSGKRKHETEPAAQQQPSKKRNRKEIAIFGNYRHYYGYRVGQGLDEDPRLSVMRREWFEGKDCLDIGCNSGLVTISIAKKFGCQSIVGVDIDGARVEDADWTLRKIIRTDKHKVTSKTPGVANVEPANGLQNSTTKSRDENISDSPHLPQKDLQKIVSFEKGNFVLNWHPPANKSYHAILCLSVTKWIHLNWGDDGVIKLFAKVWTLLQPGGVFIVEPQPWTSYYKNRLVSETTAANYQNIQITPEDFQDILLDKIGFRTVENITPSLSGSKSGFERPILAFWK
ncbi:probable RNA methyltransferase At5g51130 [Salvia hispanica]|uniref:probable RNA methyltransferase At5g51130 n=1 Tax=Salvia hispanica TaxID=49212 RepID=UPI0020090444|nr:probable RNA methyltransferase At5g51130 [Salvia hispanica]